MEVLAHLQGVGAQAESVLGRPATVAVGHVGHELVLRCLLQTKVKILMGGGHCSPSFNNEPNNELDSELSLSNFSLNS